MSTIAFFGATGGCACACLSYTLLNGYNAVALARTPSKLKTQLLEQPGLTPAIIDKQLRIIQGDATDVEAVIQTLVLPEPTYEGKTALVSLIVSGIGGQGTMTYTRAPCDKSSLRLPTLPYIQIPNPNITEQSTRTLLQALKRISVERFASFTEYAAVAPRIAVISGNGIKKGLKDVPLLFRPMYDFMLTIPHIDKREMERLFEEELAQKQSLLCGGLILVRPSLLTGDHRVAMKGEDSGYDKLRVGTEKEPVVGYTVPRQLIGQWIYEEVVKGGGEKWVGKGALLTL